MNAHNRLQLLKRIEEHAGQACEAFHSLAHDEDLKRERSVLETESLEEARRHAGIVKLWAELQIVREVEAEAQQKHLDQTGQRQARIRKLEEVLKKEGVKTE